MARVFSTCYITTIILEVVTASKIIWLFRFSTKLLRSAAEKDNWGDGRAVRF